VILPLLQDSLGMKGVDYVEVVASVDEGFRCMGENRDTNDHILFTVLAHDTNLRDDGICLVVSHLKLYSFRFTSGRCSLEI